MEQPERASPLLTPSAWLVAVAGHIRDAGPLRVLLRALVVWAIDVVALLILIRFLPGLDVTTWMAAVAAVAVIGLLNALVRPLLLAFAAGLSLLLFALVVLVLNTVMLLLAEGLVGGLIIASVWTAFVASFALAALNTALTGLLHIGDDDSFYRNVVRRTQRQAVATGNCAQTGAVIVQIDGLAEPVLRAALASGRMPTLARWLASGGHRLVEWECDIPSMTSSSQAGILWGNNANIPAFRWYDKDLGRLLVSNHPVDARIMDHRQRTANGLLRDGGSGINNIFTGGSAHTVITMATIVDDRGKVAAASRDFAGFFASPYNLTRLLMSALWEILREYWEAWQQRRTDTQPRMHRGGVFPLQRAGTNVLLRDLTIWLVIADMQAGRSVIYCDLLGYDEVAHHAGPASADAVRTLYSIDDQLRKLEQAAREAPRPYQLIVLSDHGQSWGATFRQRYGLTLEQLVHQLIDGHTRVRQPQQSGEGAGYVSATLTQMAATGGLVSRAARSISGQAPSDTPIHVGRDAADRAEATDAGIVVCASGNLGLISLTKIAGRASREQIEAAYPNLLDGLCGHVGIGWLLVRSEVQGSVVLGGHGARYLETGLVEGVDPLVKFPPSTARYIMRLSGFANVPDIVVNSALFDATSGEVAAFEELVGSHGGAGGMQTRPFLLYPAGWTSAEPALHGAESVHHFLCRFVSGVETRKNASEDGADRITPTETGRG